MSYEIFFDGAAEPNPGEIGYGFTVSHNARFIHAQGGYLGTQTNNFAEYCGLYFALKYCTNNNLNDLKIHGDSDLVIRQMKKEWKCKNHNLREIYLDCLDLSTKIKNISFIWIPREQNEVADEISKRALKLKDKQFILNIEELTSKFKTNLHKL